MKKYTSLVFIALPIILMSCSVLGSDAEGSMSQLETVKFIVDSGMVIGEGPEPSTFISYQADRGVPGAIFHFHLDGATASLVFYNETPTSGLLEVGGEGGGDVSMSVDGDGSCYEEEKVTGQRPTWLERNQQLITCTFTRGIER
jgi:hypothetical protein